MKFLKTFLFFTLFFFPLAQGYYHNGSIWHKQSHGDQFIVNLGDYHEGNKGHKEQLLKIICNACDTYNIDKNDILVIVEDRKSFEKASIRDSIRKKSPFTITDDQFNDIINKTLGDGDSTLQKVAESYLVHGIPTINSECRCNPNVDIKIEKMNIMTANFNVNIKSDIIGNYSRRIDINELPISFSIMQNYDDGPVLNSFYADAKAEMNLYKEKLKEIHNAATCGEPHQHYNNNGLHNLLVNSRVLHVDIEIGHALHMNRHKKIIFVLAGSAHKHRIENNLLEKLGYKKIHQKGKPLVVFNDGVVNDRVGILEHFSMLNYIRGLPSYYIDAPVLNLEEFFDTCPYDIFKTPFAPRPKNSWFSSHPKKLVAGIGMGLTLAAAYIWYKR